MMQKTQTYKGLFAILGIIFILTFLTNISLGSIFIPLKEVLLSVIGQDITNATQQFIITEYRVPKAITAVLAGSGLAVSGLLMQTLFRNPLAGPFVLGLSSGASLGVAILLLGAGTFGGIFGSIMLSEWSMILASAFGSFIVLLAVLAVSFRIKDTMAILIIGLMFGSVTGAVVGVLSYFSNAEQLQQYIFWSFGSLGNQSWNGLTILSVCFVIGIGLSLRTGKALNALLLGENYAKSVGLKIKTNTLLIIIATSLLAGGITAFAGPIAFVGLAVPHLTRQFVKTSNHFILLPAVMLCGGILMLVCDTIAQLPFSEYTLPINAITSLIGAPVVIWLLVRKRKLLF
ncbi:MAG: iron complex transport system permease protein [Candidatus Latescibacterota bacterium]|jgi:iron complex transport system permease protein